MSATTKPTKEIMSTEKHIWIVTGHTGEYSDRTEWIVCAYPNEADAKQHADKANVEAQRIFCTRKGLYRADAEDPNKYDPVMNMDDTGTTYRYEIVELKKKFVP